MKHSGYKCTDFKEGQSIRFIYYSNIDPRPRCTGTIEHVYGPGYIREMVGDREFDMDVYVTESESKNLIGKSVRIRSNHDVEFV